MKSRLIILLAIIAVVAGVYLYQMYRSPVYIPKVSVKDSENFRFTGTVKALDDSCNHDGVCKIKVENIWITTELGGDPTQEMEKQRGPKGSITIKNGQWRYSLSRDYVGKKVDVYVKKIDETTATLYGDSKYYIRVVE